MSVLDCRGEQFFIGRVDGICYLFDNSEMMLASSQRLAIVLDALEMVLSPTPDETDQHH
jgi:hypothetical protein